MRLPPSRGKRGSARVNGLRGSWKSCLIRPFRRGYAESHVASGHPYLFGDKPGIADLLAWFIVWFLRGRNPRADQLLAEFPALLAWEARVKSIGHGMPSPMAPAEALSICKAADPATVEKSDPLDPQGLAPGMSSRRYSLGIPIFIPFTDFPIAAS